MFILLLIYTNQLSPYRPSEALLKTIENNKESILPDDAPSEDEGGDEHFSDIAPVRDSSSIHELTLEEAESIGNKKDRNQILAKPPPQERIIQVIDDDSDLDDCDPVTEFEAPKDLLTLP